MGHIYKLILQKDTENFKKGEIYIGKHNDNRRKYYFSSGKLVNSIISKYGKEIFIKSIIADNIEDESLLQYLEVYYIDLFQCNRSVSNIGLNLSSGGDGVRGAKWNLESIEKLKNTIAANYKSGKRKPPRCKPIYKYDLDTGKLIKKYDSVKDASSDLNCDRSALTACALGKHPSAKGFTWSYEELEEKIVNSKGKVRVLQFDLDNHLIKEWLSATDVEGQLGFSACSITNCCRRRSETSHGFKWMWKSYYDVLKNKK